MEHSRIYLVLTCFGGLRPRYCNRFLWGAVCLEMEVLNVTQHSKLMTKVAVFIVASLACGPAMASTFYGEVPAGYSDNRFQIGPTSTLAIDIVALGSRDPALCPSCNSSYTDNYTVNLFNQAGGLLESLNETNYFYSNSYSSSHGIGAGPVGIAVPAGATTLEIVSQFSIAGLLGADGHPLSYGDLDIFSGGAVVAATPLPPTWTMMLIGLAGFVHLLYRRSRPCTVGRSGVSK